MKRTEGTTLKPNKCIIDQNYTLHQLNNKGLKEVTVNMNNCKFFEADDEVLMFECNNGYFRLFDIISKKSFYLRCGTE